MNNLAKLKEFLRKNYAGLIFIGLIFFVVIFSSVTLTTKPKLWTDETITIELAHSFLKFGVLDIQTAPGQFSGQPYLLQSTGYPLTTVLGLAFKFFGYNLITERIVMLLLMIICLTAIFLFVKKLFGKEKAVLSLLLIISFASFYGSGRTAVGEIPGFIFLITGLYFWLFKDAYYLSGLFLGLSIVTKPSVFLLIIPAVVAVFLIERKDFFKKILKAGIGIIPSIMGWLFLVLNNPFAKNVWLSIFNFYRNPYGSKSLTTNVFGNLAGFFHSTTLVYFGVLFFIVVLGRFVVDDKRLKSFFDFVIFYSIVAFVYYLRSPGWLRYILIAELLILLVLPPVLSAIFSKFNGFISIIKISNSKLVIIVVVFLTVIQFTNLFMASQIYASDLAIKTAAFINEKFPQKSIGVINALDVSVLLESDKRYQSIDLPPPVGSMGNNIILSAVHPDVVVFYSDIKFSQDENVILNNYYQKFADVNKYEIYTIKNQTNN